MNLLSKTFAAGGLSLLAGGAGAQEPGADGAVPALLTIDRVTAELALPLNQDAYYFNAALNVAIHETCVKDPDDTNTVHCFVDARSYEGLLTLQHYDSYRVEDGALEISTTPVEARGWDGSDRQVWHRYQEQAQDSGTLEGSAMGHNLLESGLSISTAGQYPENAAFALTQAAQAVTVQSFTAVGEQRAFSLALDFDQATQRVTLTSLTHGIVDNVALTGQVHQARRSWSSGDNGTYDQYRQLDTPFGQRTLD